MTPSAPALFALCTWVPFAFCSPYSITVGPLPLERLADRMVPVLEPKSVTVQLTIEKEYLCGGSSGRPSFLAVPQVLRSNIVSLHELDDSRVLAELGEAFLTAKSLEIVYGERRTIVYRAEDGPLLRTAFALCCEASSLKNDDDFEWAMLEDISPEEYKMQSDFVLGCQFIWLGRGEVRLEIDIEHLRVIIYAKGKWRSTMCDQRCADAIEAFLRRTVIELPNQALFLER